MAGDKRADPAGPAFSSYEEVEKILPTDYAPVQAPLERMEALYAIKEFVEKNLCRELNLTMVQAPLIVERQNGANDMPDRDLSRAPVEFSCGLGLETRVNAQVVQPATAWTRRALVEFGCRAGRGICTDIRAIRKDCFLDHDHSAYVDQWAWERAIAAGDRTLAYLEDIARKTWCVIRGAGQFAQEQFPKLKAARHGDFPEELTFVPLEEVVNTHPDLTRRQQEAAVLQKHPAIFIVGSGRERGHDSERSGDILVWNPVTKRRQALASIGLRVTKETAAVSDHLPPSIGGSIGQSRTFMYLLRTAHLGEVTVSVWPKQLKEISARHNIHLLE